MNSDASSSPVLSRRAAVFLSALLGLPLRSEAMKGVRGAPGGNGVTTLSGADPADKAKLESAANVIYSLEAQIQDPEQWAAVLDTIKQVGRL
jgi:hypothetical protein